MIEDFYFQDTTSKESLQSIAIATATAALTAGAMQASGLSNVANTANNTANGVNTATTATNTLSTTERILTNLSVGLQKAAISQSSNLHGVLGAGISAANGMITGDGVNTVSLASGAAAGVIGEIAADSVYQEGQGSFSRDSAIQIGSLSGSLASLFSSAAMNADDQTIAQSIQNGAFIGGNAAANNATFYEPGTGRNPKDVDEEFIEAMEETFGEKVIILPGTLGNNDESRNIQGQQLANAIKNYDLQPGEPINLIGHSHGGNVIKSATNFDLGGKTIDSIVMLGTPHGGDYLLNFDAVSPSAELVNVYDVNDRVQVKGGKEADGSMPLSFIKGIGSYISGSTSSERTADGFNNIQIEQIKQIENWDWKTGIITKYQSSLGPIESHGNLDTAPVWNEYVKPEL